MEEDIKKIENCIQNWKSKPNIMIKQEQFELIHILEKSIDRLKEDEATIKEKDEIIFSQNLLINKLKIICGIVLKERTVEISKKAIEELENTIIEIEQTENIENDSYIFRAR